MEALLQDIRYALRRLARSPGFTLAAVVTLALGIGATTAIFSIVHAVLLRPLTFGNPDRLVIVWERFASRSQNTNVVNPANYLDWRDRATSFSDLAAVGWTSRTFTGDVPELVQGRSVTPNFFRTAGLSPLLGRVFTSAEADSGGPDVVVLSYGLWQRRFGSDSAIVGRSVPVSGGSVTVLGVMPPEMRSMPWGRDEYWVPLRLTESIRATHSGRYLMVLGRLKPGVSTARAQVEMDVITRGLQQEHPEFDTGWDANVVSLTDQVVGSARQVLFVLLGAVLLVLLIAAANVGNLVLVRAESRRRELALRTALGASRLRLVRQWLVESLLLSLAGGAVGVLLAAWGVDLLVAVAPPYIPRLAEITVDTRVLLVAAALSVVVGIGAGLPAALGASRDIARGLHGAGRATGDRAANRWRDGLVVAQVSLALVLLGGAGLLVRSLQRLSVISPGFDIAHLTTMAIDLPQPTYSDGARQTAFYSQLADRARAFPGVTDAGAISLIPLVPQGAATRFAIVGRPLQRPGEWTSADIRIVDPGYFTTMRIPTIAGRTFTAADRADAPPVIVVNQKMAQQFWPDGGAGSAIGSRIKVSWTHPDATPEIVGVVGDVRTSALDADVHPMIYYVEAQEPTASMTLVVRHHGAPGPLVAAVRGAVRDLDRDVPLTDVATMTTRLARSMSDRRYPMLLLSGFAVLAVLLAAVGLYGLLSFIVSRRTREIGVRMALGADRRSVLGLVLRDGVRLTLIGAAIGVVASSVAARALGALLYGVGPADPLTFGAVGLLLVIVALAASYLPAARATRVDPVEALRTE
ncbi:MAG TPA: ABC transporter permease [Gemmatimonadales bacterium]|nr:ABC transporter permease [Gemmatimonadales bacterium]